MRRACAGRTRDTAVLMPSISKQLVERIRWHAGLVDDRPEEQAVSISSCIDWTGRVDGRLQTAVADFIDAPAELNLALNGPQPSESLTRSALIPCDVVYAFAEVIRLRRDVAGRGAEATAASDAAWSIETGWRAVLAGDIDDILEHVTEEKQARNRDD